MKYSVYTKPKVRKNPIALNLDFETTKEMAKGVKYLLIVDDSGQEYTSIEELENAESFRSESRAKRDSEVSAGGSLHESSSGELPGHDPGCC